MNIKDYIINFGDYRCRGKNQLITVHHRCGVCNMEMLHDRMAISNHILSRHKMRLSEYQKKFLSDGSKQSDGNTFKCDWCPKAFSWKSNLYNHNKRVHDGARVYCNQCTNSFIRKTALENHIKKSH